MKINISFELDLSGTSLNIETKNDIGLSLQNIGTFVNYINAHVLYTRLLTSFTKEPELEKALREHYEEELKLSKQIFNNYKIEGITETGDSFVFTHKEPGYKEELIVK